MSVLPPFVFFQSEKLFLLSSVECEIERIVLEVRQVDSTEYVGSSPSLFCDPLPDLLNYAKNIFFHGCFIRASVNS